MVRNSIKIVLIVAMAVASCLLPEGSFAQSQSKASSTEKISPEEKARIEEQRRIIKELESNQVSKEYVDNAIASAITNELNGDF